MNLKDACNAEKRARTRNIWKIRRNLINWRKCRLFYFHLSAVISNNSFLFSINVTHCTIKRFAWKSLKMDFLWCSFAIAILDNFLSFYYAKGFNLHNVWYLGENAMTVSFPRFRTCACVCGQLKNAKHSRANNKIESKGGKFSKRKICWSHKTRIFHRLIHKIFFFPRFLRENIACMV